MSRLEELIRELCPDGVEYLEISKCVQRISNVKWDNAQNQQFQYIDLASVDRNTHKVVETQNINADNAPSRAQQIVKTGDILLGTTRPMLKRYCFVTEQFDKQICSTGFCVLRAKKDIVLQRWLYHQISSSDFFAYVEKKQKGVSYPAISDVNVKAYRIPVPPLPVQTEIVRILDNFAELTAELNKQLTAELMARKKQYEYYRDMLLSFDVRGGGGQSEVQWRTLGEIALIKTGRKPETIFTNGLYEYINAGTIHSGYTNSSNFSGDTITTPSRGQGGIGFIGYQKKDFWLGPLCYGIKPKDSKALCSRFLYHFLCNNREEITKKKNEGGTPALNLSDLQTIYVPLPSFTVQQRIANVLDNFDAICSDLNISLPAEIEARQKQYEYYRDLLLSFDNRSLFVNVERERERERERENRPARRDIIQLLQYVFGRVLLPLNEIATMFKGEYITKKSTRSGKIPVILGGQEPAYYIDKSNHCGKVIVIARSGASAGFVSYWDEPIFITDGFGYEAKADLIIPKYLYYILKNKETDLNNMKRGAGVPHISGEVLGQILFPVPSLKEQTRIVSILDRFDTLCNDLTSGLPAEIAARRKQYEYYRDRLLTFKEKQT